MPQDLPELEKDISLILCELGMVFPPLFFDFLVHLTVHLATEVRLGGPVQYCWMYPIERYLSTLKSYVRNRSRPEGCIAERYIAEECLTFCSLYLADYIETKSNCPGRNEGGENEKYLGLQIFSSPGRAISKAMPTRFEDEVLKKSHQYILFKCDHVQPYIELHRNMVQEERIHSETFAKWFTMNVSRHICRVEMHIQNQMLNMWS